MPGALELTRLTPAQVDDQAVMEISALLGADTGYALAPSTLLRMAATGPLLVARRSCGLSLEIVGVAGLAPRGEGDLLEVVVVHADFLGTALTCELLDGLRGQSTGPSLFRRRDRPPLGWACRAAGA